MLLRVNYKDYKFSNYMLMLLLHVWVKYMHTILACRTSLLSEEKLQQWKQPSYKETRH